MREPIFKNSFNSVRFVIIRKRNSQKSYVPPEPIKLQNKYFKYIVSQTKRNYNKDVHPALPTRYKTSIDTLELTIIKTKPYLPHY